MSQPTLTICIVNFNSFAFVENIIWCLERLTSRPYHVLIADTSSNTREYQSLVELSKDHDNIEIFPKIAPGLTGSMQHGTALNFLADRVNTKYFSILDSDATWLIKNWDEKLIQRLSDKSKVIGTQATGDKFKDFPLMYGIVIETATYKKLNIDMRPSDNNPNQDTGMNMREKYLAAGYKGEVLELKNTRQYLDGPFSELLGIGEYYLEGIDEIVASHFGRGSSLGRAKYKSSNLLYSVPWLGHYLLKQRGQREKQRWINICHQIVNQQQ